MTAISASRQTFCSALLILPTIAWVVARTPFLRLAEGWVSSYHQFLGWLLAFNLALGCYALLCVITFSRTPARRQRAAAIAVLAVVIDNAILARSVFTFGAEAEIWSWVDRLSAVATTVLIVAAWSVARRRSRWWVLGLAPTLALCRLRMWVTIDLESRPVGGLGWLSHWVGVWTLWTGVIVAGILCCWGFDAAFGVRSGSEPTSKPISLPPAPTTGAPAPG